MNSGSLILIVAMFGLLWFLLIRPQRQRQQQQQQMLNAIDVGDEVLTVGGIYGIVEEVEEDGDLIVEIAEGIQVRMAKRSVAAVEKPDDEDAEPDEDVHAEDEPAHGDDEGVEETASAADEGEVAAGEESVSGEAAGGTGAADPR